MIFNEVLQWTVLLYLFATVAILIWGSLSQDKVIKSLLDWEKERTERDLKEVKARYEALPLRRKAELQ